PYRGGLLAVTNLGTLFRADTTPADELTILVIQSDKGLAGLLVDRVKTQREVVVRPLSDPLIRVAGVSGATELGDGRAVLILDPIHITRGVTTPHGGAEELSPA